MSECQHTNRHLVWCEITQTGDPARTKTLRGQCLDCGLLSSRSVPYVRANAETPWVNITAARNAWDALTALRKHARQAEFNIEQAARREAYDAYLASEEWAAKRALVLRRCGGVCEGCGERTATQVHHMSYAHVFAEFLFELLGLCAECHERYHDQAKLERWLQWQS